MREPCPLGQWAGEPGRCNWCNAAIPPGRRKVWCSETCRRIWERNHVWRRARIYARRRANYRCSIPDCIAPRGDIEINHITPLHLHGRKHLDVGCHHHQDPWPGGGPDGGVGGGLESRCAAHHQEVTSAQASARAAARRAAAS